MNDKPFLDQVFWMFLLSMVLMVAQARAADYHVSVAGSDANPGTESAPWRSIAKVNATNLAPGDRVRFRRGDRWAETLRPRSSGEPGNPITYSDYGSGPLPIITGTANDHCVSWTTTRSHLVFRNLHFMDCGQPGGTRRGGFSVWNEAAASRDILIEDCLLENAQHWNIYMTGVDGLRIRGNVIRNAELEHGIYLDGTLGVNDVVIEDNEIQGNSAMCVQFNSNGENRLTNIRLRYNRLSNCGLGGVNNLGAQDLLMHHNLIRGPMTGIYNGCDGADVGCRRGAIGGIYANNSILTSGSAWATCFSNAARDGAPDFAAFVNNICVQDAATGPAFEHDVATSGQRVDFNLYFSNRTANPVFVWQGRAYTGLDNYRANTGNEAEGLFADPRFLDAAAGDVRLAENSPAIDTGADLGFERDLDANPVPSGAGPDRGALEVASTGVEPDLPPAVPQGLRIELQ